LSQGFDTQGDGQVGFAGANGGRQDHVVATASVSARIGAASARLRPIIASWPTPVRANSGPATLAT